MAKYDLAVLGAGLGGLAAAALFSKQGKKTVVLEPSPSLRNAWGIVEKDGFLFSAAPALSYGFEHGGALRELTAKLGLEPNTSIQPLCYQVAIPGHRINVYAETEGTLEELRREFRSEIDTLAKFYSDLALLSKKREKSRIRAFLANYRSAKSFMRRYQFGPEVKSFFDVQSLFFFQKPVGELSVASLMGLCCTPPVHLEGGFAKLGDQLSRIIRQHGGDIRPNEKKAVAAFRNRPGTTIETSKGVIEAETVLVNMLPPRHKSLLLVGLLEEVIPVGMSGNVLYLSDFANPRAFTAVSTDGPQQQTTASASLNGTKALSASFALDTAADPQARLEQLGGLIPFLGDFMFFAEEYDFEAGHAALPGAETKSLDVHAVPHVERTSHRNVYAIHDAPDAPLQAVMAAQRFFAKFN